MPKIMEIIEKETGGKSYHTYKYSYDTVGIPGIDYDDSPDRVMKWKDSAETERHKESVDIKPLADQIRNNTPLLTYFLDGSRHVFKVDDIAYSKQVFPVVAGQIGVGCCKRVNKKMQIERFYRELILTLPDKAHADGWDDKAFFASKVEKVNNSPELKRLNLKFEAILPYSTAKAGSADSKLEDKAISVIQDYMIEAEKRMVAELVKDKLLGQDNYLVKDGSLEYSKVADKDDKFSFNRIRNNFRRVVGVSKSFNPELAKLKCNKSAAGLIARLQENERTPAALYKSERLGFSAFAVWYVRLRKPRYGRGPFDGIVKVEKVLVTDHEKEFGLESSEVDNISAWLLNERNPVCYGKDSRWANHLYPVYLTETYVKSKYRGEQHFVNLF